MSKFSSPFMAKSPLKNDEAKYKETIQLAQRQKANDAEVSAKLRDTYPEVKNEEVEVNWSPDGKKVEVHPKPKTTGGRA